MRHRLYFVLPDVASAEKAVDDLLLSRIEIRHIHCLAKRGTPMGNLPEASYLEKSDLVHGSQVGLVVGGLAGAVLGGVLVSMPVAGQQPLPLVALPAAALGGAIFGAWASSLIASSTPNSRLKQFDADFAAGRVLMMVDVPSSRVEEIRELVVSRHPTAASHGEEPAIPAFP